MSSLLSLFPFFEKEQFAWKLGQWQWCHPINFSQLDISNTKTISKKAGLAILIILKIGQKKQMAC